MPEESISKLRLVEEIGINQWHAFKEERLIKKTVDFQAPVKKNKIRIFKAASTRNQQSKSESRDLKMHIRLFSQIYRRK